MCKTGSLSIAFPSFQELLAEETDNTSFFDR